MGEGGREGESGREREDFKTSTYGERERGRGRVKDRGNGGV